MISTFWTKDFTSRRDIYAAIEVATGRKFEGSHLPYGFGSQTMSCYASIWEQSAEMEDSRLRKAIADARSEWVSLTNGGKI